MKKNILLILKSLISNHACVEGGRKKAWYFAIPMFIFAMLLALIPTFVQTYTKQGDALVSSNAYQMDVSSYYFLEDVNNKEIVMKISNDKLIVDVDKWNETYKDSKDASGNVCYIHKHKDAVSGKMIEDLGVYYIPSKDLKAKDNNGNTKYDTIVNFPGTEEGKTVERKYSYIIFTESNVYIYITAISGYDDNKNPTFKGIGQIYGDYKTSDEGATLNSMFVKDDVAATWKNWKQFYRDAYDQNRLTNTWQTTLIMFGINAGITIFMGFMLWVLTRGKNNLHWFGIWETQKIAYWATITPAILTTGLGFLLSSFSQVIFPLLLGVRIMWLSMKLFRPENADVYPPLKNEKVVDVKEIKR